MPGGDGTGPLGKGPGIGAGRGKCAASPINNSRPVGRGRIGRGASSRPALNGQGGGRRGIQPVNNDKS